MCPPRSPSRPWRARGRAALPVSVKQKKIVLSFSHLYPPFDVIFYISPQNLSECAGLHNSIIRTSDFFVCVNIFRYNLASPFFWILHLSGIAACGCGFLIFAFTESPCTKFCYTSAFADKRLQYVLCFTSIIIYKLYMK